MVGGIDVEILGEKVTQKKGVEISKKQKIILNLIKEMPKISKEQLKIKGELTKKSVEYNIEQLKQKGLLKRIGPDKGGYWEVGKL